MAEEAEEGFTVRDRRRFLSEEPVASEAEPSAAAPQPETAGSAGSAGFAGSAQASFADASFSEEFGEEPAPEDLTLPDVYTFLAMFLGELRNLAWLRMGLVANPASGQIERDLPQAKVAIDTVAFLASQIEGAVPPEERLPLRALVSDLQINFVEQSKKG